MRRHDTVLSQLSKQIDWTAFEDAVARHGGDHRVRRLRCRDQLTALIVAQLSGARSLRDLEAITAAYRPRLYHLNARPIARATLSDANRRRPVAIFADLFSAMAARAGRGLRRELAPVRILDATRIKLSRACLDWADGPMNVASAKLHLVYDPDAAVPLSAEITGPRVNDITPAKAITITPGATYVFDRGYYSFDWWAALAAEGCRFVTRSKKRTQLDDAVEGPPPAGDGVLAERTGRLPPKHASGLKDHLREIDVKLATGTVIRVLTNDLDSPAAEIAGLYKTRWQVELAFKWIKQNLKLARFLGTSEAAVKIQIYVALITFLAVRLAHATQSAVPNAARFLRLVGELCMSRRPITALTSPPTPPPKDPRQGAFDLNVA